MDPVEIKSAFQTLTLMQLISEIESTLEKKDFNPEEEKELKEDIKKLMELYERGSKPAKKEIMKLLQDHKDHPNSRIQTMMFNSFNKFHEKYHHQVKTIQQATEEILQDHDDNIIGDKLDKIQETAENSEFEDIPKTAKACLNYISRQHGMMGVREKAKTLAEKL
jgi:uncharacterized membrane protein YgaE (UPF0421/DUF939 family)